MAGKTKLSTAWKDLERTVSRWFGTQRNSLSGGNSKVTRSDTIHPDLFVECKYGASPAPWSLFLDAETKAKAEDKVPVLALKKRGETGFLLVCRERDFIKIASIREASLWGDDDERDSE